MAILNLTNKKGVSSIKGFVVSQTPYDSCNSEPQTSDFELTLFHQGSGEYPTVGDIIYKNNIATDIYTSAETTLDRQIQGNNTDLKVDANGVMITQC